MPPRSDLTVLHVIENLREAHGGPTFAAIGLAVHQSGAGARVAIACREGPSTPEMKSLLGGGADRPPVQVIEIPHPSARDMGALLDRLQPDVMHVHGIWDRALRAAVRAACRRGVPWVVTSHGMLHPDALAKRRLAKWAYLRFGPRVVRGARHVMTLNREELARVVAAFRRPCSIVPAGVEVAASAPSASGDFRRSLPPLGERPFVLFVGRIDRIKGIDRLLDAFALAVRDGLGMDLVVAGPEFGEGDFVRARIRERGLEGRVHMPGALWGQRKLDALAECAVYAHRPRYEGYGLAVVEAMAAGRPVVTTAACRLDDAREAGAIRVAADDDRAFADALLELASDPRRAAGLGARAHAWVVENGGWPAIERRVDAVYRASLLPGRASATGG
jgi:glycosyltransferase involved in cell wall biosynthesis